MASAGRMAPHASQALRGIAQSGTTLVIVTHHLPDIVPEIGRVILIERGRIVADGTTSRVLESGRLSALFGVPLEVVQRGGYYDAW